MLEALIAIALFSIGFLAISTLVFSATRNNTKGNILTMATLLAAEKLEDLKSEDVDDPVLQVGSVQDPDNPIGAIFNRSWTITDAVGNNSSREIEVTVGWTYRGQNQQVTLRTLTLGNGT
jgi:hypothetical protein